MADKGSRTISKHDTSQNWAKAINFVPKDGEIIVYDDFKPKRIKIGDGITNVNELPFSMNVDASLSEETLIINT